MKGLLGNLGDKVLSACGIDLCKVPRMRCVLKEPAERLFTDLLGVPRLPSRKLTQKPKKGPIKTTVLLKGGYMDFHVSLGECMVLI